ncbi:MAG: polysaccharide deacetylase family protein [Balneolaceae bacterium]
MILKVIIPSHLPHISEYTVRLIFEDFWGLNVNISQHEDNFYQIINEESGKKLMFPAFFVQQEKYKWLVKREKDDWGLSFQNYFNEQQLPVFFNERVDDSSPKIDFIGTVFFLLNRYHEKVEKVGRDNHGRHCGIQSFLVRKKLINLPLVDIYVDIFAMLLGKAINIKPAIKSAYKISPSHDVDRPFEYLYYSRKRLIKRVGGDLIRRVSFRKGFNRLKKYREVKNGKLKTDPYNSFSWLMETAEEKSLKSTFHFIPKNTNPKYDQKYSLVNPEIQQLLKNIHNRGHYIALHPSYGSTVKKGQISVEFNLLKKALSGLGIEQDLWKSRNHYLRWNEDCLTELEKAGVDVDQTLGFADQPGFRCGTSHSYYPFNFKTNKKSTVLLEPLILMETTLFSDGYLGLGNDMDHAREIVSGLKEQCKKYKGNFAVLWHNNNLVDENMKRFYKECISLNNRV